MLFQTLDSSLGLTSLCISLCWPDSLLLSAFTYSQLIFDLGCWFVPLALLCGLRLGYNERDCNLLAAQGLKIFVAILKGDWMKKSMLAVIFCQVIVNLWWLCGYKFFKFSCLLLHYTILATISFLVPSTLSNIIFFIHISARMKCPKYDSFCFIIFASNAC